MFIHGLGGEVFATWNCGVDETTSWPHTLAKEFPDVGVWTFGYPASPTKLTRFLGWFFKRWRDAGYGMALPDRALQALDLMVRKGLGRRPILLICHSLGGLLAKQILRKSDDADEVTEPAKKQVAKQTRAVLFLATPHAGATLASMVSAFRAVFGPTVSLEDLRAHDANLRDLYDWYRKHSAGLGIETVTYYETRAVTGLVRIVDPTSANPGIGADPVGLDEDHVSIAKPRETDAQVCLAARDLLRNYVLTPRRMPAVPSSRSSPAEPVRVAEIVQELPPRAEKHFGRTTELKQLTERLRAGKDCAVVGPAGMGKTALAAEAVREVVGETPATLDASPFPDGVVYLDLYSLRGQASTAWNNLANALVGVGFMAASPARERATEACRARRVLIILEGGEVADGEGGRNTIQELCSVFSPQNRKLLLTRDSGQTSPAETVALKEVLHPEDAAALLDSLTGGRVTGAMRDTVLALVEGHPLALTWAGGLLARDDDDPGRLAREWQESGLRGLSDPKQAEHTLEWLFTRSVRGLDETARRLLTAAGLLAHAPFPLEAMMAASNDADPSVDAVRHALKVLIRRGLLRMSGEEDHWQFTHVLGYRFARKETGSDPALRQRLGLWLSQHLRTALEQSFGPESAPSLTRSLEHGAALLRADDDRRLWRLLANDYLYGAHERLRDIGRLDLVRLALGAVADCLARLPVSEAQQPQWMWQRSALLDRQGDMLGAQGDLAGALAAYRESLEVSRRLAEADPSNVRLQRDLSVSHYKVGDVLMDQADLAGALAVYQESLEVIRRLAEADPSNAGWQRDLSVSQDRIGDVLRAQGDLAGALTTYRESLEVRRRLTEADPSNTGWQRNLSVSHNKVGDMLGAQGDLAGALAAYRASLEVRRRLTEADPSNAGWRRDLSWSLTRIAEFHEEQGNVTEALPFAEESLAVDERLAALDRSNVTWQRDVAVSRALVERLRG